MTKQTTDPATWTQARLLQEVYALKGNNDKLVEAVNKAIAMTLDGVVMQAIKDGTLLDSEMHAGLCLLGYIRRKALKTYEQALKESEG